MNAQSKERAPMRSGNLCYVFLAVVVKTSKKGCNFLTDVIFSYYTKHHPARAVLCRAHFVRFTWTISSASMSMGAVHGTRSSIISLFMWFCSGRFRPGIEWDAVNDHVRRCLQYWRRRKLASHRFCGLTKNAFRNDVNRSVHGSIFAAAICPTINCFPLCHGRVL